MITSCWITDLIPVSGLIRTSVAEMLNTFNQRSVTEGIDNECGFCSEQTYTEFSFVDGLPGILFYCLYCPEGLLRRTTDDSVPLDQYIMGCQYSVLAYSIYHKPPVRHLQMVFIENGERFLYDGLKRGII